MTSIALASPLRVYIFAGQSNMGLGIRDAHYASIEGGAAYDWVQTTDLLHSYLFRDSALGEPNSDGWVPLRSLAPPRFQRLRGRTRSCLLH